MQSISALLSQSNPYEPFVQQLVQLESQKKYELQAEKSDINNQKSALGQVSSAITSFTNKIEELDSVTENHFNPLKATSSDDSIVTVDSVSGLDQANDYDITISQKAKKDIMLSNVMDGSATTLAGDGDGSVDITIGDKTETIAVSVTKDDGSTKTDKEILESFSTEVNNLLGDEADSDVFSVDSNGNVQLSIKSAKTGYDERIQFANASGVLSTVTSSMTHNTDVTKLNSKFTIDGVSFERSSNTIDDAISGMTFSIHEASGTQEQISVSKDLDEAKGNIESLIEKFNEMNSKIRNKTFINGETGKKGPLQGMRSIRNLTIDLRQLGVTDMASAGAGELDNLTEIGITFGKRGAMKIDDSEKLKEALTNKADEVKKLFTADDSPIQQMFNRAETYTKGDGIISSLESGLERKIDFLDNRIEAENRYLEDYEERQRAEFAELQQLQMEGQRQLNQVRNQAGSLSLTSSL